MKKFLSETIKETHLLPSTAFEKRRRDIAYLMELKTENLLWAFKAEAGLSGWLNSKSLTTHGGWDSPTSQIRGTFTGHWLSAAARIFDETGDMQLKAKADLIVSEIANCQEANGEGWAFPIPAKYLYALKKGQNFWAPQYVCHKVMMGLLDMFQFAQNRQAFDIVLQCAEWFSNFIQDITSETMTMMMDIQETGGLMELWADLYGITKDPKHLELVRRYERTKLTEPLLIGKDNLTNMHANTTIPEIHGCARAYEVTGDEKYRTMVENYWSCAVTNRGQFATGGQTNGEVWTPNNRQSARLGELNQEHCVVYNMIRLANYLFKWTGDTKYADYIELNIHNGLFAQAFCEEISNDDAGIVIYYLPLLAGAEKKWGSKTEDFWCCHCTAVQANARYREFIYYRDNDDVIVSQYMPSVLNTTIKDAHVLIEQTHFDLGGECITIKDIALEITSRPDYQKFQFKVTTDKAVAFAMKFRLPKWLTSEAICTVNGQAVAYSVQDNYAIIEREWNNDTVTIQLPKGITCRPLADEKDTVAFMDGPIVLAGIVDQERILVGDINDPTTLIKPHNERLWSSWTGNYKTTNQDFGFYLKPLNEIIREKYTVYFPVKK